MNLLFYIYEKNINFNHITFHYAIWWWLWTKNVWAQNNIRQDRQLLSKILWFDDMLNCHHKCYWCVHNPHWMREVHHSTLNMWHGIVLNKLLGPYFFQRILMESNLKNVLLLTLLDLLLLGLPPETREST